jgi:hypothetical protein
MIEAPPTSPGSPALDEPRPLIPSYDPHPEEP